MKLTHWVWLVVLGILTLGIYPLVIFYRKSSRTKTTPKTKIDVESLITVLGGATNISGVEYSGRKLKVFIHNKAEVKMDQLKDFKQLSNIFASSKYISCFVADSAKALAELIVTKSAPH